LGPNQRDLTSLLQQSNISCVFVKQHGKFLLTSTIRSARLKQNSTEHAPNETRLTWDARRELGANTQKQPACLADKGRKAERLEGHKGGPT
jgi:hypothetical protein